ncbi:MAG: TonB-dependent receptor [Acidobacteria bacterium]|nr:TonB-dependent receptor [Acidobacteriota bacterium]
MIGKKLKYLVSILVLSLIATPTLGGQQETKEKKKPPKLVYKEQIVITASRLPAEGIDPFTLPASVSIITRSKITTSGATIPQDIFYSLPGFLVYDDVGNGVEGTVSLRGFAEGNALAVAFDGVRINEPDDNRVNLELIPLEAISRVEVIRGSASSLYGDGAMAGRVNFITESGGKEPRLDLSFDYGSYHSQRYVVKGGGSLGKFSFFGLGKYRRSDGFRQNGYLKMKNLFGKMGYKPDDKTDIEFIASYSNNRLGNPGALTEEELEQDRKQAPFNLVDRNFEDGNLISVSIKRRFSPGLFLNANVFRRSQDIDTLTTGRMAALYGGFLTESKAKSKGVVAELTWNGDLLGRANTAILGIELTSHTFGAKGYTTNAQGENPYLVSENSTDQRVEGYFIEDRFEPISRLLLTLGARYDRKSFHYHDLVLPQNNNDKTFAKGTIRFGGSYQLNPKFALYGNIGEAFLTPTVIQMFAYPTFGSNPDLVPTTALSYETGIKFRSGKGLKGYLCWYRMDMENEIVFVFDSFRGGRNENVGKSRRQGVEMELRGRLTDSVSGYASYSYTDARFRAGENAGNRIPLVPRHKMSLGLDLSLGERVKAYLEGLFVSSAPLSGDEENLLPELPSYQLLNAKVSYRLKDGELFLRLSNILNQKYETRGIYIGTTPYLTPAPGFHFSIGMSYTIH